LANNWNIYLIRAGIFASLFCFGLLTSCSNKGKVIAKVNDTELLEDEAYILMKHLGINPDDADAYRSFVEEWCENEALKTEMKSEHPNEWELVRLRSESFAGDLSRIFLEETALLKDLDTIVDNQEILDYYESHKAEFVLHDYIVKALYLKIPAGLDFKSEEVHTSYLLKNDKDLMKVDSYAKLYAQNYHFNDSSWVYFNDLAKDIPVTKYNVDNLVLNRTKTYFSDENFTYFINIIDYKLKDEAPPVDFLQNEIKNIIVANRLQELKEKNESKMIQRIKKKHEIIINI